MATGITRKLTLEGIKVLELGIWVLAPAACCILGEWGADVIKVENPKEGDPLRGAMLSGLRPMSEYDYLWQLLNRNKRGIAINLKHETGKRILSNLLEKTDVFVTNLRAEAVRGLGLDYESVSNKNPQIIYAQATGFGLNGPDRNRPGFDETAYWIRAGIMSLLGEPDCPPVPLRGSMGDLPTGGFLAGGITAALLARERFGVGQRVDTSLLASGMWVNATDVQTVLSTNLKPEKRMRMRVPNPLYTTYQTKDGKWLQFQMLQTDRFWPDVCKAISREDIEKDPRFNPHEKRVENSELIISILSEAIAAKTMAEWKDRFNEYSLIWEPETSVTEVVADPQVSANEYVVEFSHPMHGPIKLVSTPLKFSKTPVRPRLPAPELGEHTEEVLLEEGYR